MASKLSTTAAVFGGYFALACAASYTFRIAVLQQQTGGAS